MLLRRLQCERQLLVLRDGLGQLALRLEQFLLEGLDPKWALLEAAPEQGDLFLGLLGAEAQGGEIVGPHPIASSMLAHFVVGISRRDHLACLDS